MFGFVLSVQRRTALLLAALSLGLASGQASAAAPLQGEQVPGFHRLAVGDLEVTALFDGYNDLGPSLLHGMPLAEIQKILTAKHNTGPGVQTAFNAFLINTGKQLVLVDTGAGACIGPTSGWLSKSMEAAGYHPAQVDVVLLTHMHLDHVCGLVDAKGQAIFPNAQVFAAKAEEDYWLAPQHLKDAPEEAKPYFEIAVHSVAPYKASGRLHSFTTVAPVAGVTLVNEAGHTPGSTGYLFSSKGQSILFAGDIIHIGPVQFDHPELSIAFDANPEQAIAAREQLFTELVKSGTWMAAAHLPFPGIGHIEQQDDHFVWLPLPYGPLHRADKVPLLQ